jgi:hypothetical protein
MEVEVVPKLFKQCINFNLRENFIRVMFTISYLKLHDCMKLPIAEAYVT